MNEPTLAEIERKLDIAKPKFKEIFDLPAIKLKELTKDLFGEKYPEIHFDSNYINVIKKTLNDVPDEIWVCDWDKIKINLHGFWYVSEHGNTKHLLDFNEFFTLSEKYKNVQN